MPRIAAAGLLVVGIGLMLHAGWPFGRPEAGPGRGACPRRLRENSRPSEHAEALRRAGAGVPRGATTLRLTSSPA